MILQFATIILSYLFGLEKVKKREEIVFTNPTSLKKNIKSESNNSGSTALVTIFIISISIYSAYSVLSHKTPKNKVSTQETNYQMNGDYDNSNSIISDSSPYIESTTQTETYSDTVQSIDPTDNTEQDEKMDEDDLEDYSYSSRVKYGKFEFIEDRGCAINNGILEIRKIGDSEIKFFLQVSNNNYMGEISGIANLSSDSSQATFKNQDCESLIFNFLTNGQIQVTEINCRNYHGTNICFDSLFN